MLHVHINNVIFITNITLIYQLTTIKAVDKKLNNSLI